MDKRIERIIIDRERPEMEPDVAFGDWCFSVTGVNDPDGVMSVVAIGQMSDATIALIGQGVRAILEHFGDTNNRPFIGLFKLFMEGFSDGTETIQIE